MSTFDFDDESHSRHSAVTITLYALSILALIGVLCVACFFISVFTNPYSNLNPFPPPTMPALMSLPTETPTAIIITLPSTWTATISPVPSLTDTPQPTSTLQPTPTPVSLSPTPTETETGPPSSYDFEVREGSPKAIPNIYHPELWCNWMGVGGQVVDMNGAPVTGLIIRLGGDLPGIKIPDHFITLTGVAINYGRSGYEFKLADKPVASKKSLWLQLVNQAGGPLSDKLFFDTYDDCEKNLIIIDFKQVH
jgi:hypothetical protein